MRLPRLSFTLSIPRPPSPSFLFSSSRRFLTPRSFGLLFQRVQREAGEASYWKVYDDTTTDYPLLQHPTHAFNRAYKLAASHTFSSTMLQASPFVPSFPSSSSSSFATLLLLFCNGVKRREKAKRGNDQRTVTHKCRSINLVGRNWVIGMGHGVRFRNVDTFPLTIRHATLTISFPVLP